MVKQKTKVAKKEFDGVKKRKKKESIEIWDADVDNVEKYYTKKFHKYCVNSQFILMIKIKKKYKRKLIKKKINIKIK